MAGEHNLVADSKLASAPQQKVAGEYAATEKTTTQVFQDSSLWQTPPIEKTIRKPYDPTGEIVSPEKTSGEPSGEVSIPQWSKKGFQTQLSDQPPKDWLPPVKVDKAHGTRLPESEILSRSKLVNELGQQIDDQNYYSKASLGGLGTMAGGLGLLKFNTPAGLTVAAIGIGAGLYSAYRVRSAENQADRLLKQMPKEDRDRFGQYEKDMATAKCNGARGYLMSGGIALLSMSKMTPWINRNTSGAAALAAFTNDMYQSFYVMDKTGSAFHNDVANWKVEMQKKKMDI